MLDLEENTFVPRRTTLESGQHTTNASKAPQLISEPLEKLLLKQVARASWTRTESPKHIASHIDHIKFGREDYGYGMGKIEVKSVNPMSVTTSNFPRVQN